VVYPTRYAALTHSPSRRLAARRGKALNQDLHYAKTQEDEVESLYVLLKEVKKR
jgi:diphthamide synthase (EF-2-diphthine--ammonia ligase)